jgi:hypothetical protein
LREGGGGLADFRSEGARNNEEVRRLIPAVALAALLGGGCSDRGEVAVTAGPPKPSASGRMHWSGILPLLLLGAIAFGAFVAVIKGNDVGVRNALGNMSAPWVVNRN